MMNWNGIKNLKIGDRHTHKEKFNVRLVAHTHQEGHIQSFFYYKLYRIISYLDIQILG